MRVGNNNWTLPEQIGTFAPFSGKMGFNLIDNITPVVVWQSTDGVMASTRSANGWASPILLQAVIPPDPPEPFGPDRWVLATAEIELQKNDVGQVSAVWLDSSSGIYLSNLESGTWSTPKQITSRQGLSRLSSQIGSDGSIHAIYFDTNSSLQYLKYEKNESIETSMGMGYDGYGVEVASMEIDDDGFVYVLGLPRRPHWKVFVPAQGVSLIPTPIPSPTYTPRPTKTVTPTVIPIFTETPVATSTFTPQPELVASSRSSIVSIGIVGLVIMIIILMLRLKNRT